MYIYDDINNAKPGDIIEYQSTNITSFTTKNLYIANGFDKDFTNDMIVMKDDKGSIDNGMHKDYWKLVKTKPGSEAKIGDTVITINTKGHDCGKKIEQGKVFIVDTINRDHLIEKSKAGGQACIAKENVLVLCTESKTSTKSQPKEKAYYEYFQALHDKGIKLTHKFINKDTEWFSLDELYPSFWIDSKNIEFRLANHPENCPDIGTQEYMDYWQEKRNSNIISSYYMHGEKFNTSINLSNANQWRDEHRVFFIEKPKTIKPNIINKQAGQYIQCTKTFEPYTGGKMIAGNSYQITSIDADCIVWVGGLFASFSVENLSNFINCPTYGFRSIKSTTANSTACIKQKETTMKNENENITVAMTAKEYAKHTKRHPSAACLTPKTDLEKALMNPVTLVIFDKSGVKTVTKYFRKVKAAKAFRDTYLQDSDNLGSTAFISTQSGKPVTTSIPLIEVG